MVDVELIDFLSKNRFMKVGDFDIIEPDREEFKLVIVDFLTKKKFKVVTILANQQTKEIEFIADEI